MARALIELSETRLYLSSISAYEAACKHRTGKLRSYAFVVGNYAEVARKLGAVDLPVNQTHSHTAGTFDLEQRRLEHLQKQKKALLAKMFV